MEETKINDKEADWSIFYRAPWSNFLHFRGDAVSDGLIQFESNPTNSSEASLVVVKIIDREDPDIVRLNGLLTFTMTVADEANNTKDATVCLWCPGANVINILRV